jgi:signal transduction histidine kinase
MARFVRTLRLAKIPWAKLTIAFCAGFVGLVTWLSWWGFREIEARHLDKILQIEVDARSESLGRDIEVLARVINLLADATPPSAEAWTDHALPLTGLLSGLTSFDLVVSDPGQYRLADMASNGDKAIAPSIEPAFPTVTPVNNKLTPDGAILNIRLPIVLQDGQPAIATATLKLSEWQAGYAAWSRPNLDVPILNDPVFVETETGSTFPEDQRGLFQHDTAVFGKTMTVASRQHPGFRAEYSDPWPMISTLAVFMSATALCLVLNSRNRARKATARTETVNRDLQRYTEKLETEILDRQLAEAEANRAKQATAFFLTKVGHEIRTPLNAVIGMFQLMQRTGNVPQRTRRQAEKGLETTRQLYHHVTNVIDAARLDTGTLPVEPECVDPKTMINAWTRTLNEKISRSGKQILADVQVAAPLPQSMMLDPVCVNRIVETLLDNAVKFTDSGTVGLHAGFAAGTSNFFLINVFDTGPGIPAELHDTLFKRFNIIESAPNDNPRIAGLGLAICQDLAALMEASLTFEARPTGGSLFSLKLYHVGQSRAA